MYKRQVIYYVFTAIKEKGSTGDSYDFNLWKDAFYACSIDMYEFLRKRESYPWSHIVLPFSYRGEERGGYGG